MCTSVYAVILESWPTECLYRYPTPQWNILLCTFWNHSGIVTHRISVQVSHTTMEYLTVYILESFWNHDSQNLCTGIPHHNGISFCVHSGITTHRISVQVSHTTMEYLTMYIWLGMELSQYTHTSQRSLKKKYKTGFNCCYIFKPSYFLTSYPLMLIQHSTNCFAVSRALFFPHTYNLLVQYNYQFLLR
jgi:hypothetical protein